MPLIMEPLKGGWAANVDGKYKDTTIILRKMFNLYVHVAAFKE